MIFGFARPWLSVVLLHLSVLLPNVLCPGVGLANAGQPKPDAKAPAGAAGPPTNAAPPASPAPPASGGAEEREARAQALFRRGLALAAEERWSEAERIFAQSFEIVPRASTAFNRALALYRVGRMQETVAMLDRFLQLADAALIPAQQRQAVELQARARAALATLVVRIEPHDANLDVDGSRRTEAGPTRRLLVDPGTHVLVVVRGGYQTVTRQISLGAAEHSVLEVTLAPAPASPAPVQPAVPLPVPTSSGARRDAAESRPGLLPWVVMSVGGAALLAGTATGIMALRAESDLDEACGDGDSCLESARDEQRTLDRWVTATDVLLISGAAVTAAGIGLLWIDSKNDRSARVSAGVSANVVHVSFEGRL
jgi:hypothetical protein